MDEVIASLAERQHGVVARRQLIERGVNAKAIEHWVERRRLLVVHRGVYAVGHRNLTQKGHWMAAVLASGGVLSHRTAGTALEIHFSSVLEVTAPKPRGRPGISIHCSTIPADEVAYIDGIPVTDVARTLLDLAAILTRDKIERAFREAEVRRVAGKLSLPDLLERYPCRHGSPMIRTILASRRGVSRTVLESKFFRFIEPMRFPPPERNGHVKAGGSLYECDFLWREHMLNVELDSRTFHLNADAFERDRLRDRRLHACGWTVIRVTWRQLEEDPASLASDLRAVFARETIFAR
jgi:hypothetical protein